jgi:cob(I)alamin adenosyltransferase
VAIYTKKGDKGTTSLYDKTSAQRERVSKDSLIVEALGSVDELDSYLGVCINASEDQLVKTRLKEIQNNLLTIGTIIAGSGLKFSKNETSKIEKVIDELEGRLPVLKNFVFPGGSKVSSHLQFARSLARRAERRVVALSNESKISQNILTYLNRLSDYLFMLAREMNHKSGIGDEVWVGRKR